MQAALKTPLSTLPNPSDRNVVTWSEICISHQTYPNRTGNKLFPIVHELLSKQTQLKIPQNLNLSLTNTFTPFASTKSSSQSPSRPKPLTAEQLKE
ncbi:transposase, partial [Leptospira weilii]|nr:transposase [Leptospira weilii]